MRQAQVLIVEDHRLVRHVIARSLRHSGFHIIEAETAARACELFEGVAVDAAVVDVSLPGDMNGLQLGKWLRGRRAAMPLVFISGLSEWEVTDRVPTDPRTRFLHKPFGARMIVDLVVGLLSAERQAI